MIPSSLKSSGIFGGKSVSNLLMVAMLRTLPPLILFLMEELELMMRVCNNQKMTRRFENIIEGEGENEVC